MWVDPEAEVRGRMRDRVGEADRQWLAARARQGQAGARRPLAGYRRLPDADAERIRRAVVPAVPPLRISTAITRATATPAPALAALR
jgi:hypothetical protein